MQRWTQKVNSPRRIIPLDDLLTEKDEEQDFYVDSAYTGEEQEKVISKYKMQNHVNEKGYRNKPLSDEQKTSNREKSKNRTRVEHVFNYIEYWLHLNKIQTTLRLSSGWQFGFVFGLHNIWFS